MQDLSQNVSNVHTVAEQLTSAVPNTSTDRQWNTSAICSLNRILKARVKKIRRTTFNYSRVCVDYIRAYRDLKR